MNRCTECIYCDTGQYHSGQWYCNNPDVSVSHPPADISSCFRCRGYVGVACVSGYCPVALADEYAERGMDVVKYCGGCSCYKGCRDCGLWDMGHCVWQGKNR